MSIVLTILTTIAAIIVLLLLVALILPKHYSVTVSETINKPKKQVYDYISLLTNQTQYSEWLKPDPELRPIVVGTDGTPGAVLKWESLNADKKKNIGSGEQEIKKMDATKIEVELRLIKPMAATCQLVNSFIEKGPDQTVYTVTFYAYAKFPVNLPSYLFGRGFITKTQQQTLRNIKAILEQTV